MGNTIPTMLDRCADRVYREHALDDVSVSPLYRLRVCEICDSEFRATHRNQRRCPLCEDVASVSRAR